MEVIYHGLLEGDKRVVGKTPTETIVLFENKEGKLVDDTKVYKVELNEYQTGEVFEGKPYAILTVRTTTDKGTIETKYDAGWKDRPLMEVAEIIIYGLGFTNLEGIVKSHINWLKERKAKEKLKDVL
jgi:hypothetical protein